MARVRQEAFEADVKFREREARREARWGLTQAEEKSLTVDELRARARRAVVTRVDDGWKRYGITKTESLAWKKAGLNLGQAHILGMCRVFSARGWGIAPADLRTELLNGRTVGQEFHAGSNIVQVLDLLAVVRNGQFTGEFDPLVAAIAPVLRNHRPGWPQVAPLLLGDLGPAGVPRIADYLLRFTLPSPDERSIDAFNRERKGFDRTGRLGPLVKLYAEAHGVFNDPELTDRLLQNVPVHVSDRVPRLPSANLINDALRERQFYYLSPAATLAVDEDKDRRLPVPEEYEMPSTTGFALLRDGDQEDGPAGRVLLWSHGAGELTAAVVAIGDLVDGLPEAPAVSSAGVGCLVGEGAEALSLVVAIAHATRRAALSDSRPSPQGSTAGAGGSRPAPKRPVSEDGEDHVSLIYAPGEPHFEEVPTATGRKAEKRWVVRGHWRQQWYSSRGERHPLWIKAHESGAVEGALLAGDRVRVPR